MLLSEACDISELLCEDSEFMVLFGTNEIKVTGKVSLLFLKEGFISELLVVVLLTLST